MGATAVRVPCTLDLCGHSANPRMSEGLARVHSLPTLSGQLRKTAKAAGLQASSAQTGPQSPCTCKQLLLGYLQHAHFTAEKKVLKGRWS